MITTEARWTARLTEPQNQTDRLAPSTFQATRNLRHNMVAWRRKQNQAAQNGGENGTTHTKWRGKRNCANTIFAHQLQIFLTTFSAIFGFFL